MPDVFPPFIIFIVAALALVALPKGPLRGVLSLLAPLLSLALIWTLPNGNFAQVSILGLDLTLMRVDGLSVIFATVFSLMAVIVALYSWHVRDVVQQVATLLYAGSAIGAVFCGDLVSLFFFWEGTALASVFLIWQRGTEGAFASGMRYLVFQIASGVVLVAGIAIHFQATGSIEFVSLTGAGPESWHVGIWLILLAFGIKCAFPLVNGWLADAYPAATITGTVTLSAFTTKMAVYSLARGFPGTELLVYIGAAMALMPLLFAQIENDLRRVLAYALNTQLGFMVVGIGVGTQLALNGTAAHAFASVLYQGLLFMCVGAVMYRTGTSKASDLGGLYRTMPITMILCVIGAASISAFPLFSSFVAKSLVLSAAAKNDHAIVWGILVFASVGVFCHTGIKVPYFTFFGTDSGKRPAEAPRHMLAAMGITAFFCIAIGVAPALFYSMLPFAVDYQPYTFDHVVTQLQLLFFALLAFALLMRFGLYPMPQRAINLDFDWFYRKPIPWLIGLGVLVSSVVWFETARGFQRLVGTVQTGLARLYGYDGRVTQLQPTGTMALWLAILLCAALVVSLLDIR